MVSVDFKFIMKSGPTILMGGGILFLLLHYTTKLVPSVWIGGGLIGLGIFLSLVWAGIFRRF